MKWARSVALSGTGAVLVLIAAVGCGTSGDDGSTGPQLAVAPLITTHPVATTVSDGGSASFFADASGSKPLSFQWRRNGFVYGARITGIGSASSTGLTIPVTYADNGNQYSVEISNDAGSAVSAAALLTVTPRAPTIVSQPTSVSVPVGSSATFSVVTSGGTAPVSLQWKRNGVAIAGGTQSTYSITSAVIGDNGATFAVDVINPAGTLTSAVATLTVMAAPIHDFAPLAVGRAKSAGVAPSFPGATSVRLRSARTFVPRF